MISVNCTGMLRMRLSKKDRDDCPLYRQAIPQQAAVMKQAKAIVAGNELADSKTNLGTSTLFGKSSLIRF